MLTLTLATVRAAGAAETATAPRAATITATMAVATSCVRLNRRLTYIGTLLGLDEGVKHACGFCVNRPTAWMRSQNLTPLESGEVRCAGSAETAAESVEWGSAAATGTDPLCNRLPMRALSARMCLLPCPAGAQSHRPVSAWALLRLECLLLRVRQVRNILGKPQLAHMALSFRRDLLACEVMAGSLATVLICDDEPSLRELIRVSLAGPYRFAEADDGEESLEMARRLRPEVVILDMMMPRLSGLEVLVELRRDEAFSGTAVIVLTAQPGTREEALREGADLVMVKPFEPEQIMAAVEEVLTERR